MSIATKTASIDFNSRPSARGDFPLVGTVRAERGFQFTPLREGRPCAPTPRGTSKSFQFTPLREGRRPRRAAATSGDDISIHAPPRGATYARYVGIEPTDYFNSRPSARGDGVLPETEAPHFLFQFTPLREGRQAPTPQLGGITIFQFTPLREGRHLEEDGSKWAEEFQFTPLREGRPISVKNTAGVDIISIHAPPARGDSVLCASILTTILFQFTPLREGRRRTSASAERRTNFNSRPSARGDAAAGRRITRLTIFQFTPLREGRQGSRRACPRRRLISIHAPPASGRLLGRHRLYVGDPFQFTPLREGRRTLIS